MTDVRAGRRRKRAALIEKNARSKRSMHRLRASVAPPARSGARTKDFRAPTFGERARVNEKREAPKQKNVPLRFGRASHSEGGGPLFEEAARLCFGGARTDEKALRMKDGGASSCESGTAPSESGAWASQSGAPTT
jgi:hypothetical protein